MVGDARPYITRRRANSQSPVVVPVNNLPDGNGTFDHSHLSTAHQPHSFSSNNDTDSDGPRPISASSSLDPYYFMISSRNQSPMPPVPSSNVIIIGENLPTGTPVTPFRDRSIPDRGNLIGVGDLATPRWTQTFNPSQSVSNPQDREFEIDGVDDFDTLDILIEREDIGSDSPWTIEAIDGDGEEQEEAFIRKLRSVSPHTSAIEESGGEEILYPRQIPPIEVVHHNLLTPETSASTKISGEILSNQTNFTASLSDLSLDHTTAQVGYVVDSGRSLSPEIGANISSSSTQRQPRKAHPNETRHLSDFKPFTSPNTPWERRRKSHIDNQKSVRPSSTSSAEGLKVSETIGTTSISMALHTEARQQESLTDILVTEAILHDPIMTVDHELPHIKERQSSTNVAHSLLKGTQEGWSVDDDSTAEALRKLDGVSGKSARARGSIGNVSRSSSHSRPATPGVAKSGGHRETVNIDSNDKASQRGSLSSVIRDSASLKDKDNQRPSSSKGRAERESYVLPGIKAKLMESDNLNSADNSGNSTGSGDEIHGPLGVQEKISRKSGVTSARSSFTPKRGSASSTIFTGTPTTSSRDSEAYSIATSATSVSAASGRFSLGKSRRNSAGSDVSSIASGDGAIHKDRVIVHSDYMDSEQVPPVPPLPKDLSNYKPSSQPSSNATPGTHVAVEITGETDLLSSPSSTTRRSSRGPELRKPPSSGQLSIQKSPSKKWSFSNALNLKRSSSPNTRDPIIVSRTSPVHASSEEHRNGTATSKALKSPNTEKRSVTHFNLLDSNASLTSVSSVTSLTDLMQSPMPVRHWDPERNIPSRSETTSSASTSQANAISRSHRGSSSPVTGDRRETTIKRLTPSAIPFFRRSSSHSVYVAASSGSTTATSPTVSSTSSPSANLSMKSHHTPKNNAVSTSGALNSTHKKSSVLGLGIPALLKGSSSRRSLQADKSELSMRELTTREKEKTKKEDKDRSESRISVLMGRKRGKTLSATDPKKITPIVLPPMQMSAIPQATAQRLASLQSSTNSTSSETTLTRSATTSASSRAISQTISSMQKQTEIRSSRHQLPTIAGSPSVGSAGSRSHVAPRIPRDHSGSSAPPATQVSIEPGGNKETPTKIPRIASRSSTVTSPGLKNSSSLITGSRRISLNSTSYALSDVSYHNDNASTDEFGIIDRKEANSPRAVRQTMIVSGSATANDVSNHKLPRESLSFSGLRKVSSGSIMSDGLHTGEAHHRFSALSPSKGLNKFLAPKGSLSTTRIPGSLSLTSSVHQVLSSPSSSRHSLSTPSPVPSSVDEDEVLGDEEMMQYIKRQQARKLANGAKKEELDEMLRFPEPQPRGRPLSPASILASDKSQFLSDYERKEILDYPSVYYFGANSEKKMASRDNSTNNFGYDDERGDYLVVAHDHLAYRYEIITTLGKGSFGQVLHCRDHCTGESVAVKIIRNKKRFHKQAEVEIKILESLSTWDPDEKHNVIKMTEHFSFRDHLCIAMELLSINLYELIKANGFSGFTTTLIRRFASQMLLSLSLMRHHRIVHCDLKPENVLLKHPAKSAIKVIDFGSSCFEHEKVYTYIQSRFYRSPEVILGMNYHMAIDMWSLGCILAELYTGFPIFPGENEQEQLSCIMEVLGVPDKELLSKSTRKKWFFDSTGAPRPVVNSKGRRRRPGTKSLPSVLHCDDENFVDFIAKCLIWDPERRIKPQTALRHPFLSAGRKSNASILVSSSRTLLSSSSFGAGHRSKVQPETPKKSQISAPTPLTARVIRVPATQVPSTPTGTTASSSANLSSSSRSHRTSQTTSSHRHGIHRPLNGYLTTSTRS